MAKFTEIEEQLLEHVDEDRLRTSLAAIRQATEDIWATDAPRVIQDHTDHSITHSERLVRFAAKLLDANDGRDLSSQEMYLLLAGIYLHDIGMQCDVVEHPDIRTRAEALGAQLDVAFTAQTAKEYSLNQQKAIRKNHHYLSAGWIDHANRTGETVLGPAAKTIPEDLVDDLMDVCKHHAKVPISDCPLAFRFDPTRRKQMVAALLRLSDELDVDGHRVSIETVKNFRLNPRNSVYWWLHNRTKVVFSARNVILVTIRMHPDELKQYGSFVHATFITEFRTKNWSVLSVLAQNGIPILISDDSKVVEHDRVEPLPREILQAMELMQQRRGPLSELSDEVRTWLQVIRYEVSEPQQRDNRTVDMVATLDLGTVRQRVLVRCIGGEITSAEVDALDEMLNRNTPQGWLISDTRVSHGARGRPAKDNAIQVFNLSDFLRQMVWGPYFDALMSLVESDRIPDLYVDLGCYKQEMDEEGHEIDRDQYGSLDDYIDNWLTERGKMHISLLGEFGSGKTWFCRHYAYRQLKRYLKDPANQRLPLLITLRTFTKSLSAQQLINDVILEQYKLPFVGSAFEVFQDMNRRGKLVLVLDGFDEMAQQVDYQTMVDNFWELTKLVNGNSKVILTSRTEYFRWVKESEKILGGKESGRRTTILSPPKFEILNLGQFSDDQIREVIARRLGSQSGPIMAKRILNRPNLANMARKPVLVGLLLAALDEMSTDVPENQSQVYLYATNKLLLRNIDTERTFTTTADKLYFLCELAWEMIKSGDLRMNYRTIPKRIKVYFGNRIKDQRELDTWDFDLRSQTLLHRDAAGYYEFAHRSLAEYFVALKFAAELGCLSPTVTQTYCEATGQSCKFPVEQKDITQLTETIGAMALSDERMRAVGTFLKQMMAENATKRLWKFIEETRGKIPEQVKYVGGNAVTLLKSIGAHFRGRNLSGMVLTGAELKRTDLSDVNLSFAVLDNAELTMASLKGARCVGTSFRNATLHNTTMEQAVFEGADFTGADVSGYCYVYSVSYDPGGRRIATGGDRPEIAVWDVRNGEEVLCCRDHTRSVQVVLFSPKGEVLVSGGGDGYVRAWNTLTGKEIWSRKAHKEFVRGLSFDPTGRRLASVGEDNRLVVWDANTGERYLQLKGHERLLCVSFSPDGKLLVAGARNGTLTVWDSLTGREVGKWQAHFEVLFVAFTLDSSLLISAGLKRLQVSNIEAGHIPGSIKVWKTITWQNTLTIPFDLGSSGWLHWSVSPTDTYVAGRTNDKDVVIWDYQTGKQLSLLRGHYARVFSAVFSPDGNHLASSSEDGSIRIWDVHTGECIQCIVQYKDCRGANFIGARGLNVRFHQWLRDRGATIRE